MRLLQQGPSPPPQAPGQCARLSFPLRSCVSQPLRVCPIAYRFADPFAILPPGGPGRIPGASREAAKPQGQPRNTRNTRKGGRRKYGDVRVGKDGRTRGSAPTRIFAPFSVCSVWSVVASVLPRRPPWFKKSFPSSLSFASSRESPSPHALPWSPSCPSCYPVSFLNPAPYFPAHFPLPSAYFGRIRKSRVFPTKSRKTTCNSNQTSHFNIKTSRFNIKTPHFNIKMPHSMHRIPCLMLQISRFNIKTPHSMLQIPCLMH